jgi:hypothetical protein
MVLCFISHQVKELMGTFILWSLRFGAAYPCSLLSPFTLKMEAEYPSETLLPAYQTALCQTQKPVILILETICEDHMKVEFLECDPV